jgi:uncharacterized protein
MFEYRGKYALVTGASKGLGRAYAEVLAERGMNLVLVARSLEPLNELAEQLRLQYQVKAEVIAGDISDPSVVTQIFKRVEQLGIRVDLLLNNAGLGVSGPFISQTLNVNLSQVSLNAGAVVAFTRHFSQHMVAKGSGGIINVSSNAAFQPVPYLATYAATKAFVLTFTEAIAEEMRETGVRIMVACPGPTSTEFFSNAPTTLRRSGMDAAHFVARRTLEDFDRGTVVSYPGRTSVRLSIWATRLLPRSLVARLSASVSRKMGFAG